MIQSSNCYSAISRVLNTREDGENLNLRRIGKLDKEITRGTSINTLGVVCAVYGALDRQNAQTVAEVHLDDGVDGVVVMMPVSAIHQLNIGDVVTCTLTRALGSVDGVPCFQANSYNTIGAIMAEDLVPK